MRATAVLALLIATTLGGCLAADTDASSPNEEATARSDPPTIDGTVSMDVPVPVFLLGFDAATAAALDDALEPTTVGDGAFRATAQFQVHAPDDAWQEAFDAFLDGAVHPGNAGATGFPGTILDGNAIEAYLAEHLSGIHPVPDGINALVILDAGHRNHAYHYDGDVGWREPVRAFGERSAMLIWDPHAEQDPWVGTAPLHSPTEPSTDHLVDWVHRATAIRALQMPIWPPTTLPCHAITVVLAVRNTAVTDDALGLQGWEETLDMDKLQATYENLTGDAVHVDLVVLQLPVDDPPLDAITRENSARTVTQNYLDLNFDQYHVGHDGCEPYLSLVVYGDLADQRTQSNGNAIMLGSGRRISTSLVAENVRIFSEVIGYNDVWDESTNFERVGPGADPREWFNWVVSHETGHLFSLPHPNYSTGATSYSDPGFASTWNVMGYQMRRIVTETSAIDTNNFARNQAGAAVLEADDVPSAVVDALAEYRWKDATRALQSG